MSGESALPNDLLSRVGEALGAKILNAQSLGGGCIAQATRLETSAGSYFLKWGTGAVARTLSAEAKGLEALSMAESSLVIPDVVGMAEEEEDCPGYLILSWIEEAAPAAWFGEVLGEGLAELHRYTAERYGFEQDNFIGRRPQHNDWAETWPTFFRERRLMPQVRWARQGGAWQAAWDRPLERLVERLPVLLPEGPPASLLHGDLWSCNVMATAQEGAALIDPAVYYGHREADLAMTELFGGFPQRFYAAYRAAWPLEPGYEERRDVYNLYHLINHLNHFGASYAAGVDRVLRRFKEPGR